MNDFDCEEMLECFTDEYSDMVSLAKQIGVPAFNGLLDMLGGTKPHIPKREVFWGRLGRECRDESIRARFNGTNHQLIAEEHGLSLTQVYRILHHQRH